MNLEMKRTIPFALVFVAACSSSVLQPREPTPGKTPLTLLSYNVNYGIACDPPTLATIEKSGADVILLQETTTEWEKCLRDKLSGTHPHSAFRHSNGAGGLAVLSKAPFDDKDYIPSPIGWFPSWRVVVHSALGDVQILQVHLRPQVSDSGSWVSGHFTTGHYRKSEIEVYTPYLDSSLPAIVAGDFNEQSGGALDHLESLGLRDVINDFDLGSTWRWSTAVGTIHLTLDHVLYRGRITPLRAEVLQEGRSDHLPVRVVFEST